jgi:hypothetical protein
MRYDEMDCERVIEILGKLIVSRLNQVSGHQRAPGGNPDDDDSEIQDGIREVKILRKMRTDFEEVVTGAIVRE